MATLEERNGTVRLVFHEAKHFANTELRAAPDRTPPVIDQIRRYEATIGRHEDRLASHYVEVCRSLVAIDAMRRSAAEKLGGNHAVPELHPLIQRVAEGNALQIDPELRLVIFGFDEDQKNGAVWKRHLSRLQEALGAARVYAVGNTRKG